ncbi:MAG: sigma-54-dependent Fis family transcriptional regulator [Candidatus Aminicenantes bacterium]|nr:sigma-54-dependent Fis family transcriptional regulator [Candidatus Aminicenantes bacterium]
MTRILVIDDDQAILNFLRVFLIQAGKFSVHTLQDNAKAYEFLEKEKFDILLLDMDMPNVTGLDILQFIKENDINIITVVLTGVEDIDLAISAMKLGTFDYMLKPIEEKRLLKVLDSAIDKVGIKKIESESSMSFTLDGLKHKEAFKKIITVNDEILKIFHIVEKFAETDNSILIWGESGTGKELIAQAIHKISAREDKKFIAVNSGAFANELFSSEFFGHSKGSFTGAISDKKGFLEDANGGTLFLDEIGELSLPIQVKLLRVLQEGEFYRLGSTRNLKVDVRIIAATNKNLFDEIKKGNFRKDLFFRLNINSIYLPPLRDRKEDILLLADYFLKEFNKKYKKKVSKISRPVQSLLTGYHFPGNIRELMNIINSAIIVESNHELRKKSLPHYFLSNNRIPDDFAEESASRSLVEVEREHIKKVLKLTSMNKTRAAKILGISRVNLISKTKKYKLE